MPTLRATCKADRGRPTPGDPPTRGRGLSRIEGPASTEHALVRRSGYLKRHGPLKRHANLLRQAMLPQINAARKKKRDAVRWPQRDRCRELPCCSCGRPGPSDPAHIRTRGSLAGAPPSVVDRANVVPLCRVCHSIQGSMPIAEFEELRMTVRGRTMKGVALEIAEQLEAEGVTW